MKSKKSLQKRKVTSKHAWFGVVALLFGAGILAYTHMVSAETVSYSMTLKRSPNNCPMLVNNSPIPGSTRVKQGDTVNLTIINELNYPMMAPKAWLPSQYNWGTPAATFTYTGSDSSHRGTSPWTATVENVQQDLMIAATFGIGETCFDAPSTVISNVYVDVPETPAQQPSNNAPSTTKKKTATQQQTSETPETTSDGTDSADPKKVELGKAMVNGKETDITKPFTVKQTESVVLSGTALPNATVTLTIHSNPRTVTIKADAEGKWSYTVSGLEPGDHYVEASVTDPTTGQTTTPERILSFEVAKVSATVAEADEAKSNDTRWLLAGLGGLALVIAATVLLLRHKLRFHLFRNK